MPHGGAPEAVRAHLRRGVVIPAHPLALTDAGAFDERRQRALTRYYVDAGAGGIAVGVHTTQFAIRDAGLHSRVLEVAAGTAAEALRDQPRTFALVAGVVGRTSQAVREAETAARLGYDTALLSLAAFAGASDNETLAHCRAVAAAIPLFGFYLQPAVGGRVLSYDFWRAFAEIEQVWAIKIAPFNRYQTLDVVRAVADAGRHDIALYTGNDDAIVHDLITPIPVGRGPDAAARVRWFDGGLLGQWAVGTRSAVTLLERCHRERASGAVSTDLLRDGAALTAFNAAMFDARNGFAGCIPGIHAVLAQHGLMASTRCLDPLEQLSPGQETRIAEVCSAYPGVLDSEFVARNLPRWLG